MPYQIHASDDDLELYSLGRLEEPELGTLEEHLLICAECQTRLEAQDDYTNAARSALQRVRLEPVPPTTGSRWAWSNLALGGALAIAGALLAVLWLQPRQAQDIQLVARRGAAEAGTPRAKAGSPVRLQVAAAELAAAPAYDFEVTDSSGHPVWSGRARVAGANLEATVPKFSAGNYWVRLYSVGSSRELLNEFALLVR